MLCLTETGLTETVTKEGLFLPGYVIHRENGSLPTTQSGVLNAVDGIPHQSLG